MARESNCFTLFLRHLHILIKVGLCHTLNYTATLWQEQRSIICLIILKG